MLLRIAIISIICIAVVVVRVMFLLSSELVPVIGMWIIVVSINYVYGRHRYHRSTFL
jgi:1,4-dihydroxy-2-naphthoate octaprenyltransferase